MGSVLEEVIAPHAWDCTVNEDLCKRAVKFYSLSDSYIGRALKEIALMSHLTLVGRADGTPV